MDSLRNIPGGVVVATVIGVIDAVIVWGVATLFDVSIQVPDGPGSQTLTNLTIPPIIFIVAAIPLAALGLLNPMIAAAAMAFSSVSVVANSLRLRRFE